MRARTGDVTLAIFALAAWAATGGGAVLHNGNYSAPAIELVSLGVYALVLGALYPSLRLRRRRLVAQIVAAAALLTALATAVTMPAGMYGSGPWLTASRDLTIAAASLAALWYLARLPRPWTGAAGVVALQALAGVAMIRSSPRPKIDDWFMLQAVTRAMTKGQDIYTVTWKGPPHEMSNMFAYLPGSAVLVWPFRLAFGDVRYGILAALVATAALLIWVNRNSAGALLGCLPLLYPRVLFGLEQSWIDPLVLLGVCGAAIFVARGRHGWAVVSLAASLACKQQAWLVVPVALVWRDFGWRRTLTAGVIAGGFTLPWALADFHAFFFDVFQYQLHLPAFLDSLSLYPLAISHGGSPTLAWLVLATLAAVALALWRLPRDTSGFLFGAALVMTMFNFANKQSFFNEWELSAGLAAAAAVFAIAARHSTEDRGLAHAQATPDKPPVDSTPPVGTTVAVTR